MAAINPEMSDTNKKLSPTYHVTALFISRAGLPMILDDLEMAGFSNEDLEVFLGAEGADKLDFKGKHQGVVQRFLHDLVMLLSDETIVQSKIEEVLRAGGMFVSVNTRGDVKMKHRALVVLKSNQGKEVTYWGPLAIERP